MVNELNDLDMSAEYTYADYLKWNFDERLELIRGKIFLMSPVPNMSHQSVSSNIHFHLRSRIPAGFPCKLFYAPFDVRLPSRRGGLKDDEIINVVQPDLILVCDSSKLDKAGCLGAPELVVEIVSPYTSKKDLLYKYTLYEESGVLEYWLVQPREENIIVYELEGERFKIKNVFNLEDELESSRFPGITIPLKLIFES